MKSDDVPPTQFSWTNIITKPQLNENHAKIPPYNLCANVLKINILNHKTLKINLFKR
jgi:hypothetical protein